MLYLSICVEINIHQWMSGLNQLMRHCYSVLGNPQMQCETILAAMLLFCCFVLFCRIHPLPDVCLLSSESCHQYAVFVCLLVVTPVMLTKSVRMTSHQDQEL